MIETSALLPRTEATGVSPPMRPPVAIAPAVVTAPSPAAPARVVEAKPVADVTALWRLVQEFARSSPRDEARIEGLTPEGLDQGVLRLRALGATPQATRFLLTQGDAIAQIVRSATGHALRVELSAEGVEDAAAAPRSGSSLPTATSDLPPIVRDAMTIFHARVVAVERMS